MMVEKKQVQDAYLYDEFFSNYAKGQVRMVANFDDYFPKNNPIVNSDIYRIFGTDCIITYSDYILLMWILYDTAEKDQQKAIVINAFFETIVNYSKRKKNAT